MKAFVKENDCIGCGMCANICPQVFEIGADGLSRVVGNPDDCCDAVAEAAAVCPVNAIEVM